MTGGRVSQGPEDATRRRVTQRIEERVFSESRFREGASALLLMPQRDSAKRRDGTTMKVKLPSRSNGMPGLRSGWRYSTCPL